MEKLSFEGLHRCDEVAERYGVKVETVWEWIRKGRLPATKIGKVRYVTDEQLAIFEESYITSTTKSD